MRYILDEKFILCGFRRLPFALRNEETKQVHFCGKQEFAFLFSCSGKVDVDLSSHSEQVRLFAEGLLAEKVIREAADGETRDLSYVEYTNIYKHDVQWSVTGACNYRCKHCFQSATHCVLGAPSLEECLDVVRQLDECGIKLVAVTGGEPLIRSDLFEIFDEMLRRDMAVTTIYSNGKLITQEFLDKLKVRNMHPGFQISFDGVGYHDWMRGVDGAERIALNAFRLLHQNGFHVVSAMCLCRENVGSIRETVKTLASVGCTGLKLQCCMPQGEWKNQPEHFLSYDETLQAYLDYLPAYQEDGCPLDLQMEGFFAYSKEYGYGIPSCKHAKNEEALHLLPPCGVIYSSLYIGPNGAVVPCMSMCGTPIEKQFPNLSQMSLQQILTESNYTELTGKKADYLLNRNPDCVSCDRRLDCCSGCRAFATGGDGEDYFAVDPITCKILKEGWDKKVTILAEALFPKQTQKPEETKDGMECESAMPIC